MTTTLPPPVPTRAAVRRRHPVLPYAVIAWALAYGAVRVRWALVGAPEFPPLDTDLVVFTGWWAVALCAAAGLVGAGLAAARFWRPALAAAGWVVCAAVLLSCALLLLDVVGLLILDPGAAFHPGALLSRLACLTGAALLHAALLGHRRRLRGDCRRCGRTGPVRDASATVPAWARAAAWAAVLGCLLRLAAQLWVGFEDVPLSQGASMIAFEVGFLLAGVLLPLALVHSWGWSGPAGCRCWPAGASPGCCSSPRRRCSPSAWSATSGSASPSSPSRRSPARSTRAAAATRSRSSGSPSPRTGCGAGGWGSRRSATTCVPGARAGAAAAEPGQFVRRAVFSVP
ncbi:hypothetical protein ACSNOB_25035 [Micromonospora sp. URMC 106]|uniref:hypothetical protein n=1 Tax=Micromonospora sp. URMC 106 TaxID=3423408 RepID=UPI003F197D46